MRLVRKHFIVALSIDPRLVRLIFQTFTGGEFDWGGTSVKR